MGGETNNPNYTSDYSKTSRKAVDWKLPLWKLAKESDGEKTDCPKGKEREGFRNGKLAECKTTLH